MLAAPPAPEPRIDEATYRRLAAGTVAKRLPPFQVKGKREAVDAYELLELSEDTGATTS